MNFSKVLFCILAFAGTQAAATEKFEMSAVCSARKCVTGPSGMNCDSAANFLRPIQIELDKCVATGTFERCFGEWSERVYTERKEFICNIQIEKTTYNGGTPEYNLTSWVALQTTPNPGRLSIDLKGNRITDSYTQSGEPLTVAGPATDQNTTFFPQIHFGP